MESAATRDVNTTPEETQRKVSEKILAKGRSAVDKRNNVLQRLRIEYVAMDAIRPNPYNPNRQDEHDFELLCKSMEEDGFTQPIIVQMDGTIVDGEHRWRAARTLGYKEVPVVRVDMTEAQAKISTLRHNRARGSEDIELTAALMKDLEALGAISWAQDSLMLDDVEMNKLLNDIAAPEALAGEQFGEAWTPSNAGGSVTQEVSDSAGQQEVGAASMEASDRLRQREAMLKAAKSDEERQMVLRDTKMVKIHLAFTPEQAAVVRQVLGTTPAERLFEICRGLATPA